MSRLKGKVAIITGGSGGIGAETARLFASEGASVVVSDIAEEAGQVLAKSITDNGGKAAFLRADVTSSADWEALVSFTRSTFSKLDVLINNAGTSNLGLADPTSIDDWNLAAHAAAAVVVTRRGSDPPRRVELSDDWV